MTIPEPAPSYCTAVDNNECTVPRTLYGYRPNMGANAFFAAFFGICLIWHIGAGIKYKTWTFMIALGFGCLGEMLGYIGRIMLNDNPYSEIGFNIQICCLIISPAFVAGGIYLTLKHIVLTFGESWSRLKPSLYTWIFISCDIFSLVLQGAGGGIAASAEQEDQDMQDVGTNLMIAGIIFQVVVLVFFGYFLIEYTLRTYRRRDQLSANAMALFNDNKFRGFVVAIMVAYLGIFIRCVYRIPELTGGWRNELMRNETDFIILEGVMIVLSVLFLTVFHPGYCFPALGSTIGKSKREKSTSSDSEMADRV